jgi:hypothetical protein
VPPAGATAAAGPAAPAEAPAAAPDAPLAPPRTLAEATLWHRGIENVDVSHLVTGHVDYRSKLEAVTAFVRLER